MYLHETGVTGKYVLRGKFGWFLKQGGEVCLGLRKACVGNAVIRSGGRRRVKKQKPTKCFETASTSTGSIISQCE